MKLVFTPSGTAVLGPGGLRTGYEPGALNAPNWGEITLYAVAGDLWLTIEQVPAGVAFGALLLSALVEGQPVATTYWFPISGPGEINVGHIPASLGLPELPEWAAALAAVTIGPDGVVEIGAAVPFGDVAQPEPIAPLTFLTLGIPTDALAWTYALTGQVMQ